MISKKTRRIIEIPLIALLTGILIAGNIVTETFSGTFDWYFGTGEISGDSANFYNVEYTNDRDGKRAAGTAGSVVGEKVSDEGEILLKNDGLLPLAKSSKVTPLGYRYADGIYKGVGSGALGNLRSDLTVYAEDALDKYFDLNKTVSNKLTKAFKKHDYSYLTADGYTAFSDEQTYVASTYIPDFADLSTLYDASDIGEYKTAIVFIGRNGGENADLQMTPYYDGTPHELALTSKEKETISFAENNFDHVILILNSSPVMEIGDLAKDPKINAILWIGTTGTRGMESMAKILCGEVNPSGRTVDTYAYDSFSAPANENFGDFQYEGSDIDYVEYEEGIYVGYRYYETGDKLGTIDYDNTVLYPFGYGLHYDNDKVSQSLTSAEIEGDELLVKGTIQNSSSYDVKETVQIYVEAPYHNESKIEKSAKSLVEFDKIEVKKGASEDFEIAIALEDLSSYDYRGYYNDNGCYVLESGDYLIHLGKDSHRDWGSQSIHLDKTLVYADSAKTGEAVGKRTSDHVCAQNLFEDSSLYMDASSVNDYAKDDFCTNLSREDFLNTYPTAPNHKSIPNYVSAAWDAWQKNGTLLYQEEIEALHGTAAPSSKEQNGLLLSDMRGLDYDDPKWDLLLNQLDYSNSDLDRLITQGCYYTHPLEVIGQAKVIDTDGPQGITLGNNSNVYCGEVVLASTWNKDLAKEVGEAIGAEMFANGYGKLYGPALNIHRSVFSGRNYEYYSEDPVLAGYIAAEEVSGLITNGCVPTLKHFALNNQETNRTKVSTYCNEQAMREIYFKPFELANKKAKATIFYQKKDSEGNLTNAEKEITGSLGVMVSMNCIGSTFTACNRPLLQNLLRDEWGFLGTVCTDTSENGKKDVACPDQCVAAGVTQFLGTTASTLIHKNEAYMKWAIRDVIHNGAYAYANSFMTNVASGSVVSYGTSPWRYFQLGINIGLSVIAAGLLFDLLFHEIKDRREPKEEKQ